MKFKIYEIQISNVLFINEQKQKLKTKKIYIIQKIECRCDDDDACFIKHIK